MISILPYDPAWPAQFAAVGRNLREALGTLATRIDHIGSTSVPGLAAKDILDIQVTVQEFNPAVEHALRRAGFGRLEGIWRDHVPPGQPETASEWTKWLFKPAAEARPVNLHVRVAGRLNQRYPLLFRDYLRAQLPAAEATPA